MKNNWFAFQVGSLWRSGAGPDLLIITLLWCLAAALANPFGEFPINDDWSWTIAVKRLLVEGEFHPLSWTAMTLLTHVLWGALFCKVFGFSFTTLRFCNLFTSLIGTVGVYLAVRQVTRGRWPAMVMALCLAFNPIYFALSLTFMTDVTFFALTVLAVIAFLKGLRSESPEWVVLATGLSAAALLCRQLALFLPMAFGLSLLVKKGFSRRSLVLASLPTLILVGTLLGFNAWLRHTNRMPSLYSLPLRAITEPGNGLAWRVLKPFPELGRALLYFGLFLAPVLLILPPPQAHDSKLPRVFSGYAVPALFIVISAFGLIWAGRMMPLMQNVFGPQGIGQTAFVSALPRLFWVGVTIASLVGGGFVLRRLALLAFGLFASRFCLKRDDTSIARLFLLSGAAIYLLPVFMTMCLDRYLLPVFFLLGMALLIGSEEQTGKRLRAAHLGASLLLGLLLVFSVAATRDVLTSHRTRWVALQELMATENVAPSQIEGGFEFDSYYSNGENLTREGVGIRWRTKINADYVLAGAPVPGFDLVRIYRFSRWLPPQTCQFLVLKRRHPSANQTGSSPAQHQ